MSRLLSGPSGRRTSKFFALGFAAVLVGFAVPAGAHPDAASVASKNKVAKAKGAHGQAHARRAALTASDQDFRLFGTSFCVPSSVPGSSCDVAVPEGALALATPRADHPPRVDILGISFCSEAEATGPACDVAWQDPQPAQPWRDAPEIRTADVMPRQR
jgi:hypothetical protein